MEDLRAYIERRSHPEPNTGCWLWTGTTIAAGYGWFTRDGARGYAHRASYASHHGPIPSGMHVLHRCDNPACVNPAHLWLGTNADNIADKCAKGRQSRGVTSGAYTRPDRMPRGRANGAAVLTDDKVREMRRMRASGARYEEIRSFAGVAGLMTAWNAVNGRTWAHVKEAA